MSTKKELIESSKQDIYKPTPHMIVFVETAVRLGTDSVAEIVRETGIDESNYYKWRKDPEFMRWMNEYANQLIRGDGWKLNNIGMRKAKQDHRYWESMQKIVGNIKDGNQTNIGVGISVNIVDYKPD